MFLLIVVPVYHRNHLLLARPASVLVPLICQIHHSVHSFNSASSLDCRGNLLSSVFKDLISLPAWPEDLDH